jgi:hypothetical protein
VLLLDCHVHEERKEGALPVNSHRFRVGQQLHLSLGPVHPGKFVTCHVVKLLPVRDGLPPEYQVRNSTEDFDRRASEGDLAS